MSGPWQPTHEVSAFLPEAPIASGLYSLSNKPPLDGNAWEAGYYYTPLLPGTTIRNRSAVDGGPGDVGDNIGTGETPGQIYVKPWVLEVEERFSTFQMRRYEDAAALLEWHTSRLLEHEFWTGELSQAADLDNRYLADESLREGDEMAGAHAQDAVARVVGCLSSYGVGQIMVHVPKRIGLMLPDGWKNEDTLAEQGFVVVSGAGYPDEGIIYGTEICNVRVSEVFSLGEPRGDNINIRNNEVTHRAQRIGAVDFAGPVVSCTVADPTIPSP
jgi:hypothetical protein